eukprot:TRINITY_DN68966_c0_g1_i1.p1 TRINITY_DN68966_c0_g1~~TRINITY_DN68966_c0_g1_i1.p1  ORF type:complete len:557 (-),score=117.65 TRINITY_DN68966_c0_g1_i1:65-1735(-)
MGAKQTTHCLQVQGGRIPDVTVVLKESERDDLVLKSRTSPWPSHSSSDWQPTMCLRGISGEPDTFLMLDEVESEADRAKLLAREEEQRQKEAEVKRQAEVIEEERKRVEAAAEEERRTAEAAEAAEVAEASEALEVQAEISSTQTSMGTERLSSFEWGATKVDKIFFAFSNGQQVRITRMPMGFILGFPWLDVRRVQAGSEAQLQGLKAGWTLQRWGVEADQLQDIMEDSRDAFREALSGVAKQLPTMRDTLGSQLTGDLISESVIGMEREDSMEIDEVKIYDVKMTIVGCKGLADADWMPGGGGSDPYCQVQIVGKGSGKFQTATISDSRHPQWNETHILNDFQEGDYLLVSVYDEDQYKSDDLLGQIRIPSKRVIEGFKADLVLRAPTGEKAGVIRLKLTSSAKEDPRREELFSRLTARLTTNELAAIELNVYILEAKQLRDADWGPGGGASDPYCVCELKGQGHSKFRTKTIQNSSEPKWNAKGKLEEFRIGDDIVFSVFDEDYGKTDDFLGQAVLKTDQVLPFGFKGNLRLMDGDKKLESSLTVQVKIARRY